VRLSKGIREWSRSKHNQNDAARRGDKTDYNAEIREDTLTISFVFIGHPRWTWHAENRSRIFVPQREIAEILIDAAMTLAAFPSVEARGARFSI
jgi:hypothetical protein